jgi:hypothetical protein
MAIRDFLDHCQHHLLFVHLQDAIEEPDIIKRRIKLAFKSIADFMNT